MPGGRSQTPAPGIYKTCSIWNRSSIYWGRGLDRSWSERCEGCDRSDDASSGQSRHQAAR